MIVTLDALYNNAQENLELFEHLFNISTRQNEDFILILCGNKYIFHKRIKKEVRTKAFRKIIEEHKPP